MTELTREQEDEIIVKRLRSLSISAAYADDTTTEEAIWRVALAGGWEDYSDGWKKPKQS
jgi:hypothetical protein